MSLTVMPTEADALVEKRFDVLTYGFRVRMPAGEIARTVERLFGGFHDRVGSGPVYEITKLPDGRHLTLTVDGTLLRTTALLSDVVEALCHHVFSQSMGRCERHLLVHAGVLIRHGQLIVMPARSGSGKTTLVAGLVAAGFSYLSDECAPIDPATGEILPFPVPLSVKPGSFGVLADLLPDPPSSDRIPHRVRPHEIGRVALAASGAVRFVVAPRYVRGAPTRLEPITRAEGLAELMANTFNLTLFGGRRGFRLLAELIDDARCYRLTFGDLSRAVASLTGLVAGPREPPITCGANAAALPVR